MVVTTDKPNKDVAATQMCSPFITLIIKKLNSSSSNRKKHKEYFFKIYVETIFIQFDLQQLSETSTVKHRFAYRLNKNHHIYQSCKNRECHFSKIFQLQCINRYFMFRIFKTHIFDLVDGLNTVQKSVLLLIL